METVSQPTQASAGAASRWRILLPLLATVLVMLTVLTVPRAPVDLDTDADTSLSEVLSYAHQQGLQFGTDLVFTYGPLGYLTFFYFSPPAAATRLAVDAAVCFVIAAGLCLAAWRGRLVWGCALVGVFLFVVANVRSANDHVLDAGLFCWGLLCFVESGRRLTLSAITFVALAVFGALAKTSVLFMAGPSVVLLAADLILRGQVRLGAGMVVGFGAGFALGWVAAGQHLSHLPSYLANALAVIHGYNQSLGCDLLPTADRTALLLLALALALVIIRALTAFEGRSRLDLCRRILLLTWLCSLLLLIWKHGLVRGDYYHLVYFFCFLPVLALALDILPAGSRAGRFWARVLAVACCLVSVFTLQSWFFEPIPRSLAKPIRSFVYHARCLLQPGEYLQTMNRVVETNRSRMRLPALRRIIGGASVDVFGQLQVCALLNDLNYRPCPVFQSYAACSAPLMRLNEQFYLSEQAPEFVIFALLPIDRKFPSLENAMVLRDLLTNYEPAGDESGFLLLRRKSSQPPQLTLLREGTVRLGERIDLWVSRQHESLAGDPDGADLAWPAEAVLLPADDGAVGGVAPGPQRPAGQEACSPGDAGRRVRSEPSPVTHYRYARLLFQPGSAPA